jgi:hypothetical protein
LSFQPNIDLDIGQATNLQLLSTVHPKSDTNSSNSSVTVNPMQQHHRPSSATTLDSETSINRQANISAALRAIREDADQVADDDNHDAFNEYESDVAEAEAEAEAEADKLEGVGVEVERWQRYTIRNIIETKNSERKTLPSVSLHKSFEKMRIKGKRYRSDRGRGNAYIVIAAKQSEEQIKGPPSYLELYQSSFHVYTPAQLKKKVQDELKLRASKLDF